MRSPQAESVRYYQLAVAGALISLLSAAGAWAQESESPRVAKLIEKLSASDYQERAAAVAELTELGSATKEQLTAALSSKDAEVRLRAADLLTRLEVEELWGAKRLDLPQQQTTVSEMLELLAKLSGNHIMAGERYGSFEEADLKLQPEPATFWQALDLLCRQSGNHVRPHYNPRQPGLVVVSGKIGKQPVAHAGPLRAQITSAKRVFNEELDYETGKSEITHTFQMHTQVIWEDRFRLVAYRSQPEVVSAVTNSGELLEAEEIETPAWNVASPGIRQLSSGLRLSPPLRSAKSLKELTLRWELIAVGSMQEMDMTNLQPDTRKRQDNAELLLEKIEERPGGRYIFTVMVSRDLATPELQDALLHENELELYDASGQAFNHHGETNSLVDRGVRMTVTFQAPQSDVKPHQLKLRYPRIRTQRSAEIVFTDVPLPVAGPE